MAINLGNVVGLLRSQTAPTKKYVLWAKILNPSFPDLVELHYWDNLASTWVPLLDPTHQYWLRPVIDNSLTVPPASPVELDRYMIPASATGAWAGKDDQIATWKGGAWQFTIPLDGYIISVRSNPNSLYDFRGVYGTGGFWAESDFSIPVTADQYIPKLEKGSSLGVAPLDSSAKLLSSYLYPDTIGYNPSNSGAWPVGTNTIKEALDHIITIANGGPGGGPGDIPGLSDVLGENNNGGGQSITNVNIDASLITSGVLNIARIPAAALERLYVYAGAATQPENAGLTTANVQNGDTVKMNSTGFVYAVVDDTQLNLSSGYVIYTAGGAASVPWAGVTGTPSIAGSGGYGIQSAALTILGNPTNGLAYVTSIAASADNQILRRSGTTLGFGTVPATSITVSNTAKLMGRFSASGGPMEEISLGTGLSLNTATGTLSATGTLTGTGVAGTVAIWTSATNITNNASLTYDATNTILKTPRLQTSFVGTPTLGILDGEIYYSSTLLDYRSRINGFWSNMTRMDEFDEPGTSFTPNETYRNCIVRFTSNSPVSVTLPPGLSTRFVVTFVKAGLGDVTISTAGTYTGVSNQILVQNTAAAFYHSGANVWRAYGSLGPGGSSGGGGGGVSTISVGNVPNFFTTNVANATTTPAVTYTLNSVNPNLFWAGPVSGIPALPNYRAIDLSDLPRPQEVTAIGTSLLLDATMDKKIIRCTAAGGCNIILPAAPALPTNFTCTVYRNVGPVTFSGENGSVTLEGTGTSIPIQYGYASVWYRSSNVFSLGGLLTSSVGGGGTTYTFNQGLVESGGVVTIGGPISSSKYILYPSADNTQLVSIGSNLGNTQTLTNLILYAKSTQILSGAGPTMLIDQTGIQLKSSSAVTLGDLYYISATGYLTRIPIGASAQVLTVSGGIPSWQNPTGGGGGGVTGGTNGVTAISTGVLGLGGALSQNTSITMGANQFVLSSTSGAQISQFSISTSVDRQILNLVTLTGTEFYRSYIGLSGALWQYNNNGNIKGLTLDKAVAGIQVLDSYSTKGLVYSGDYSLNYTAFSIPHLAYINSKLGGQTAGPLVTSPTVTQNGFAVTWDNTNLRYTLTAMPSGGGSGTVTSVSASTSTFITATVSNATTTPAIALTYNGTLPTARGGTGLTTIGAAGQAIRVNGAGTALEYYTPSGFSLTDGNKGDISVAASGASWLINAQAVTFSKFQNSASAGLSVVGRSTNTAGAFAEIATTTDGAVLRLSGTTLGFGTLGTLSIANSAITYAKIQNISATQRFLGRITAGAGVVEELTIAQATSLINPFTASLKGLVNPPTTATGKFLRDDNTWQVPAGGGGISNTSAQFEIPVTGATGGNLGGSQIYNLTGGNLQFGATGSGGITRSLTAEGSALNVNWSIAAKGTAGAINLSSGGPAVFLNTANARQVQISTTTATYNTITSITAGLQFVTPTGTPFNVNSGGGISLVSNIANVDGQISIGRSLSITAGSITSGAELGLAAIGGTIKIGLGNANILIQTGAGKYVQFDNVPTSNPGGTNRLWNNAGVLSLT